MIAEKETLHSCTSTNICSTRPSLVVNLFQLPYLSDKSRYKGDPGLIEHRKAASIELLMSLWTGMYC